MIRRLIFTLYKKQSIFVGICYFLGKTNLMFESLVNSNEKKYIY